jgi:predicted DsbA family dithiol-disulfide isomerase
MHYLNIKTLNKIKPITGKEDLAVSLGLDKKSFLSCLNNSETSNLVDSSIKDGVIAGVNGTPATFVLIKNKNGYEVVSMIAGAQEKSYFEAAINSALSK